MADSLASPARLQFGLLGTGFWADTVHAAGLAAHPRADLVGVWGRDPAKAAAVAKRHGARAFADLDELLERVDAVAVAVPPDVQPDLTVRAARAGCHLLLEKPLSLSEADARRVVAEAAAARVASVVFFTARFAEPTADWFRDVVSPGEWDGGRAVLLVSVFTPGNPFGESPWRREHGALWDVAPHALASLVPALGPVEEVAAVRGAGDTVELALTHTDGRASSVTVSLTVPPAAIRTETVLWGPGGTAVAPYPPPSAGPSRPVEAFARAVSELAASIETGAPHPCDARFAADVVGVLAAAERFLRRPGGARGERPQDS
jgi:predicted dehydrogenase